jgi:hypothetical protein
MKLANFAAGMTDWTAVQASVHPGESGTASMRVRQLGDIQLRPVEYSAGFVGDHWCHKGHLTFVVAGQMQIEHQDGAVLTLSAGTSWHIADDDGSPHRARSESGATVFVVD